MGGGQEADGLEVPYCPVQAASVSNTPLGGVLSTQRHVGGLIFYISVLEVWLALSVWDGGPWRQGNRFIGRLLPG